MSQSNADIKLPFGSALACISSRTTHTLSLNPTVPGRSSLASPAHRRSNDATSHTLPGPTPKHQTVSSRRLCPGRAYALLHTCAERCACCRPGRGNTSMCHRMFRALLGIGRRFDGNAHGCRVLVGAHWHWRGIMMVPGMTFGGCMPSSLRIMPVEPAACLVGSATVLTTFVQVLVTS